ncbi:DUF2971 domain-containing protein [Shewanella benthica]|nr:DUF2971 domain-containing protein [Shewanella benthica]
MKQLFKYMSHPRDFFEEGFIRLSQPKVLNDPFEASFCQKSLDELAENFDDSTVFDSELGELSFSKFVELRMNHIGIISFTENKENLLMWAHYANEHKGIVAGVADISQMGLFENLFSADFLLDLDLGWECSLYDGSAAPVSYRKGLRYRNDKYDYDYSNISVEGADRVLYEVFMQKSDEWIYEQEHRVILRLEQADRVIVHDIDDVSNSTVAEKIRSSPFASLNTKDNSYIINLFDIENKAERETIAIELAKLSMNPKTIYLMKLSSSSINNCLIGLNSEIEKDDVLGKHACSTGYLDIWKAKKNLDYYSIEFELI